jgi:hypothetical protein
MGCPLLPCRPQFVAFGSLKHFQKANVRELSQLVAGEARPLLIAKGAAILLRQVTDRCHSRSSYA